MSWRREGLLSGPAIGGPEAGACLRGGFREMAGEQAGERGESRRSCVATRAGAEVRRKWERLRKVEGDGERRGGVGLGVSHWGG